MTRMSMPKLGVGGVSLGEHDRDWFIVICALTDSSVRAKLASIVGYYIRRRKAEYEEILAYTAAKHGLTKEDCFQRLLNGESLGEPIAQNLIIDEDE